MDNLSENAAKIVAISKELLKSRERVIIALDGRSGSGKSTLAAELSKLADWNVFHTDDFFPRSEQRTAERLSETAGNFDYERFLSEVLLPLRQGEAVNYRRFDCGTMRLSEAVKVSPQRISLVEGVYSCHPTLWELYDYRVFFDISPKQQLLRIAARNPESVKDFAEKWIPFEERYFFELKIAERCGLILGSTLE